MRGFLRDHATLSLFVIASSIVAAIVYELSSGGKPRAFIKQDPRLNYIDMRGDRPTEVWTDESFECLGWRATYGCDPHGQRDYTRDRKCDEQPTRTSGYCEIRDRTSGDTMRVMLATCTSWQWWLVPQMTCNDARAFTDYSIRAARYKHSTPLDFESSNRNQIGDKSKDTVSYKRGVSMIGYPKVIAGVYAIVRMLRHHGCALPVEVWIDPLEMRETHSVLVELVKNYNVIVRTIQDPLATKFHTKPYALYHSYFESVLFLDSDNIPAKDPTYLFDTPEFVTHGAMFWPDFWRPEPTTPFNVHEQSVLWPLLDMPFIDMFEQESGQLLVDRRRSHRALEKLMFYSSQVPKLLNDWHLVYGDKDLFRLAWLNTSTPFHFVPHLVALGGLHSQDEDFFCGVAMVQRDPSGEIIFMHRNQAKLNGRRDQKVLLTHLQKFIGGDGDATSRKSELNKYRIACNIARLGQHNCFYMKAKTDDGNDTPLLIQSLASTKYPATEKQAIHFSIEGRHFLTKTEEAAIAELESKEAAKMKIEADEVIGKRRRTARNDQIVRIAIIAAIVAVLLLVVRPVEWWRRRRNARRAPMSRASTNTPASPSSSISISVGAKPRSGSANAASLLSMGGSSSSSSLTSSSGAVSSSVEASWRRKKSFAVPGEDPHIL